MTRILIASVSALILTACGGGGGDGPVSGELGSYENPHAECTFKSTHDYFESKEWCIVIKAEGKTWKNLSYMAGEDDCKNPEAVAKYHRCRIYSSNNIMSVDYLEGAPAADEDLSEDFPPEGK
jgi:hypothetical protein